MSDPISCSFCGTMRGQTAFMYEGPAAVICGECVAHAVALMAARINPIIDHDPDAQRDLALTSDDVMFDRSITDQMDRADDNNPR